METSASFTQSTTVERCRCTAWRSTDTTLAKMLSATYLMLLSLLDRNLNGQTSGFSLTPATAPSSCRKAFRSLPVWSREYSLYLSCMCELQPCSAYSSNEGHFVRRSDSLTLPSGAVAVQAML